MNFHYAVNRAYRNEMMRQAAQRRMAQAAQPAQPRRVLSWVGYRLVATGRALVNLSQRDAQAEIHAEAF